MRSWLALLLLLALPVRAEVLTLPGPDGLVLRGVLERPAAPTRPTIIALHGCSGLGGASRPPRLSAREREWVALLVEAGHAVLFPDSFGSRELGPACGRADHAAPPALRAGDALAARDWAAAQPWNRGTPVLLGWSHGGSTTLHAWARAAPGVLAGAIAFYPGCGPVPMGRGWAPVGHAPLLLQLGEADDWTPAARCVAMAARAPGRVALDLYPGAHHGFDAPDVVPMRRRTLPNGREVTAGPDPAARTAARRAVEEFLARHAPPPG
jgi:dienelactone hydrolase